MTLEIITQTLHLRLIVAADINFVHALHLLPQVDEYNTLGIPENIDETITVLNNWIQDYNATPPLGYTFAIELADTKKVIGLIGIRKGKPKYNIAEVWYKLHPVAWGNGYATEALKSILAFGFQTLQLHRIEAGCATANIGSIKVMEKAGMLREGMRRKVLPLKSGWADNYMYGILATDFIDP